MANGVGNIRQQVKSVHKVDVLEAEKKDIRHLHEFIT